MKKYFKKFPFALSGIFANWYSIFASLSLMLWAGCGSSKLSTTAIEGWQIKTLKTGEDITLFLKNSDTIEGKYKGIYHLSEAELIAAYNVQKLQHPSDLILPSIGDTVILTVKSQNPNISSREYKSLFVGFDSINILVRTENSTPIRHVPFSIIEKMTDKLGNITSGSKMNELTNSVQIPLPSIILISTHNSLRKIATDDILQVYIKHKSGGEGEGVMIGVLIGAVILVVGLAALSSAFSGYNGHCPYVYSFNGSQYILDSETFAGANFKASQRTDFDILEYLKESNGSYRMKLTNELEESQYIDEFKIMVVDHPSGSKIMPDFTGELHTLNSLNPPIKAIDQNGNNVLELINAKDQNMWISNPFTRNPENKSNSRDAMIVEFKKPKNATQVKLAFNVQNTDWTAYMQNHMLSLHGNKLNDWYAQLNNSQSAQSEFNEMMIREVMLLIQLWNGNSWKTQDYIWEVGPRIAKDLVVKLDLSNYSEENLRIRLESTVGFWMINSVEADYSDDARLIVTELSATKAMDQSGNNLLDVLKNSDGHYYVQPTTNDWAEISFTAIPIVKNTNRSFILKCNGYYISHADATGNPQQELLNKLISEPGAYAQYTLRLLNQKIANRVQDKMFKL